MLNLILTVRVAIKTAIQRARTVTFILQSNKNVIPNFDIWYGLPMALVRSIPNDPSWSTCQKGWLCPYPETLD